MRFECEQDDDGRLMAAYVYVSDSPVARTVEIRRGQLMVDEAEDGSVVGVEFIYPESIRADLQLVGERYGLPDMSRQLDQVLAAC